MSFRTSSNVEACETESLGTMARAEAVHAILERTKSLERFLVHKSQSFSVENAKDGMEDESDKTAAVNAKFRRPQKSIRSKHEYNLDTVALKHRHVIASVNKQLNNLSRYTLEARLKILVEHRQEFQVDIKTFEEYLSLLRKLDVADDKGVVHKIETALKLMAESSAMRSSIEARIQEVNVFLSEASDKLDLGSRRQMMLGLGVRHGAYGSALSLRDHEKSPQSKYQHLLDFGSLTEQANGTKVVSRKSEL
ncbi:hypothetical protein DSL72_006240 [Monilinia vaccinii-corymbosi]|uniref:Uncharacterized protein n=1 Tax=Monilinia vaccinii-corymbosi TaxID=61207 RepID=A0A8A3PN73_9HELO|nr:hypothetical protein DSL72_006240 [Monilinia vaccinii-corymbosi]